MKKRAIKKIDEKHLSQISLSPSNRLTYVYGFSPKKQCMEIICVSLDIQINDDWVTIIRYDNHHDGILHRHTLIAYDNTADIVDYEGTKRKGDFTKLLRWTINDIKNNYLMYKHKFLKRNHVFLKGIEIDEY